MYKKVLMFFFMTMYLYTLLFEQFLNQHFRIPTPLMFGLPLVFFFGDLKRSRFIYGKEIIVFVFTFLLLNLIVLNSTTSFIVDTIVIVVCALYFNYFVKDDKELFNKSILVFVILLTFSAVIMFLNHILGAPVNIVRSKLIGGMINQSPSGISASIFTFGYQIAALSTFIFIYSLQFSRSNITKILAFCVCALILYFGLNRSAVIAFLISSLAFIVFYYKQRVILVFAFAMILGATLYAFNVQDALLNTKYDNVFAKDQRADEAGDNRSSLITENLKIYADYPFGLIFHGKSWADVTKDSLVFRRGLFPHNAYLQFITFLGPILGFGLLAMLYGRLAKISFRSLGNMKESENRILACLLFSFLAISINAAAHNASLFSANGPTVFIYFAILHYDKMNYFIENVKNT